MNPELWDTVNDALSFALFALSVIGIACAQIEPSLLVQAGYPRLAKIVRIGVRVGAFAIRWRKKKP